MTELIDSLKDIAGKFDVAVLDQYGVLHDGHLPYPGANSALSDLRSLEKPVAILSNSGRRASTNRDRILRLGVDLDEDCLIVTSGEVCWHDLDSGQLALSDRGIQRLLSLAAQAADAPQWASANRRVELVSEPEHADAILLMGMPTEQAIGSIPDLFAFAIDRQLTLICTNPDRVSPGRDRLLPSPGGLADQFVESGGSVIWYGKPYRRIFEAVGRHFPDTDPQQFLMVGDSMEHDVAGAAEAGWSTVLVRGGIHRDEFNSSNGAGSIHESLSRLADQFRTSPPDYSLELLR